MVSAADKADLLKVNIASGSGVPDYAAPKGSLYINLAGSSTSTRMYVNTTGSTVWASFTTSA